MATWNLVNADDPLLARTAIKSFPSASVTDYGAVGDGVTDDTTAISSAFASGVDLYFPAGDYLITTALAGPAASMHITGENGARLFSSTLYVLMNLQSSTDVTFENITFETELVNAANLSSGLITAAQKTLTRYKFLNCKFLSPNAGCNGLKIVTDGMADATAVDDFLVDGCYFDTGRMGVEFTDHTAGTFSRIRNVTVQNSTFDDCCFVGGEIQFSYSGRLLGCSVLYCHFIGGGGACIEYARDCQHTLIIGNTFEGLEDGCKPITMTNNTNDEYNYRPTIALNKSMGRSGESVSLWQTKEARLYGNEFTTVNIPMDVRGSIGLRADGDIYDGSTSSVVGVGYLITGPGTDLPSTDCAWTDCTIIQSSASITTAPVRFSSTGAVTTNNRVVDSRITRGASSTKDADDSGTATGNSLWRCGSGDFWRSTITYNTLNGDHTMLFSQIDADEIIFDGALLTNNRTITIPLSYRTWLFYNDTDYILTFTTPGITSAQVAVPSKGAARIAFNGTVLTALALQPFGSLYLNFGVISAQSYADLTITVTGAVIGDAVALGVHNTAVTAGVAYTAWVSAADTVTVRAHNYTGVSSPNPAGAIFKASIIR